MDPGNKGELFSQAVAMETPPHSKFRWCPNVSLAVCKGIQCPGNSGMAGSPLAQTYGQSLFEVYIFLLTPNGL